MTDAAENGPRIGLLSNPQSRQNRLAGVAVLDALMEGSRRTVHKLARTPEEIHDAMTAFAEAGVDVLAVNGGDGTVHAALDGLLETGIFDSLPLVAVLAGGRTNMTANDVGVHANCPRQGLERLLAWTGEGDTSKEIATRSIIRLEAGGRLRHGLFLGAAGLYQAASNTWDFQARTRIPGMQSGFGTAVSVGSQFARHLMRRGPFTPDLIRVRFDDEGPITGEYLVLFITTLDKMALGMRPFWDDRPGPLRLTSVNFAHRHLLRAVPSLLRGKPNGVLKPENGYSSRNAHCIELELETGCMLDGEVVEPQPGTPIRLTADQSVQFLCL